jgi:hypothetical protein
MPDALDFLRKAAFHKRINGVAGGNRILWQDKDLRALHDYVMSARHEELICDDLTVLKSSTSVIADKASLAKIGIELRDFNPDDFAHLCLITNPTTDHTNDSVKPLGIDYSVFWKNSAVLDSHDSSKPPVASSGRPFMSGDNVLAITRFPKPGISANSDQIRTAANARLLRGISIGFIPLKWSMSKDPARPMGIDFHAIKLLEFSYCSLPMNPDCRVLGSVSSGGTTSPPGPGDAPKMADLRRDARALAARARSLSESITVSAPQTREQRIVEAQAFRRAVLAGEK